MSAAIDAYAEKLRALYEETQGLIDAPGQSLDPALAQRDGASIYARYAALRTAMAAELEIELPEWTTPTSSSLERDDLRLMQQSIFEAHEALDELAAASRG